MDSYVYPNEKRFMAEVAANRWAPTKVMEELKVKAKADEIFDLLAKFADYGFNKSHAAAYALVCYQTAYLKANHPVEFFAATMTLDMGNVEKLNGYRRDLEKIGVELLPPDVNRSSAEFTVELDANGKKAIRYALAAIKGVGREAMVRLTEERVENGAFKDLFDFAERLDQRVINKRLVESLVRAGAFDTLNKNRAQTFAAVEALTRHSQATHESRGSDQNSLFGDDTAQRRPQLPKVPDWAPMERLQQEFSAIGFYLSSHPLAAYERSLQRLGVCRAADLPALLARGTPGEVYNIGGGCERTNRQIVDAVCALLDELRPDAAGPYRRLIRFVTDRPGHDRRYAIDARKIERELGWRPAETFETGIHKTVRWYLEHAEWVAGVQSGSYRDWVSANYNAR